MLEDTTSVALATIALLEQAVIMRFKVSFESVEVCIRKKPGGWWAGLLLHTSSFRIAMGEESIGKSQQELR